MKLVGKSYVVFGMGLVFVPLVITGTTYGPYDVYCDTALYRDTIFCFTLTNTAVNLFGTVLNYQQLGGSTKVASIDFALTNGYSGVTFDFLFDSINVVIQKYNADLGDWQTYSYCRMKLYLANIYNKTCRKYRVELDYPHTDNVG